MSTTAPPTVARFHGPPPPGTARLTLATLGATTALLGSFPWSARSGWSLAGLLVWLVVLFGWWRGTYCTEAAGRWAAFALRPAGPPDSAPADFHRSATDAEITTVLRISPAPGLFAADIADRIPLEAITSYLDRYGVRCRSIRVTSNDSSTSRDSEGRSRTTWVALAFGASENMSALRARSQDLFSLRQVAEATTRRFAEELREAGWNTAKALVDDPDLALASKDATELWNGVAQGDQQWSVYSVVVAEDLSETLAEIWSRPTTETWTGLELTAVNGAVSVSVACAFLVPRQQAAADLTAEKTGRRLVPRLGEQLPALRALRPFAPARLSQRPHLAGGELLGQLQWPADAQDEVRSVQ